MRSHCEPPVGSKFNFHCSLHGEVRQPDGFEFKSDVNTRLKEKARIQHLAGGTRGTRMTVP